MRDYHSNNVRNVVVLGHAGSGKSSVVQAMLKKIGKVDRIVSAESGQSMVDFEPQEVKRNQSIYTALVPIEWEGKKINFIDTPGYLDFMAEMISGYSVGDNALIVVDAKEGVDIGTRTAFNWIQRDLKPTIFFVNKMDDPEVSFHETYNELREAFGNSVIAFEIPIRENGTAIGSINLLSKKVWYYGKPETPFDVPEEYQALVSQHWEEICEAVAMTDDGLMESYFENGDMSEADILKGVSLGVRSGDIRPVYCGSAMNSVGIRRLLDLITEYLPSYGEKETVSGHTHKGEPVTLKTTEDEKMSAQVFKTIVDPFVGRISYLKVMSGVLSSDSVVTNVNQDEQERVGSLYSIQGKHQLGVGKLFTGDIGAVAKLSVTHTFETLAAKDLDIIYDTPTLPQALLGVAIWPSAKKDEDKLSQSLAKVIEEEIGARSETNPETNELILYGLGDQHLDIMVRKLKDKYGVDVTITVPEIAYRETIRKKSTGEGRHKKQSGGAGQFGHVFVDFEPFDTDEMVFEEKVFGGAVPRQYFPAVEQGLREAMVKGILAGYKVVGVKATLTDGKYHEVDSKEIAFKQAARLAYLDGMPKANPILLEPIVELKVHVPDSYTGAVIGDLNKRRGIIMGMDAENETDQCITAEVPLVEVSRYLSELRSISQGRGTYEQKFLRYDAAPEHIAQAVIQRRKKDDE
ncbi:elongation factor G [Erysipelothrix larvae]|uniref:Elongation factor G n=1 Tax=Erysipelothrix larvae TaxID=1514105 RepID=A0A0X8H218_9FIRM|nr:elongation factor G [Erysipelothrix larvae]AMC94628.1 elongation factor G [Erysipelothrix larvae]